MCFRYERTVRDYEVTNCHCGFLNNVFLLAVKGGAKYAVQRVVNSRDIS
jgi:hypothetical protein